jgi:hypothetical protein
MNEHLKEQLHEGDPMAEYFQVKNHKVQMRSGVGKHKQGLDLYCIGN